MPSPLSMISFIPFYWLPAHSLTLSSVTTSQSAQFISLLTRNLLDYITISRANRVSRTEWKEKWEREKEGRLCSNRLCSLT